MTGRLLPSDPARLGGHRLLARLGEGGMGVVYLARTRAGRLVALKVIRAEHAADPQFRARFRREARLAARVSGRWVVPVTDADPEAQAPWLATEFVPGPTLGEAVAGSGPLPVPAVLTLGLRIADALAAVHAAGLVHRDVKPGNIVLGHDGPHLIDFGIVRGGGATALTAADAIIGTPGYLSPEQTRAYGDDVGPASDLFSLGCVLLYAVSGRPPFGGGDPATVLYRTVHEEPDLTGLDRLPRTARTAVTHCLAKEAADRPTAAELRAALSNVRDPRSALVDAAVEDHWLPPAVLRSVAAHSARALDPPPREGVPEADSPDAGGPRVSRRRVPAIGASAAGALAAGGIGAAALALRGGGAGTELPVHTVGLQAVGREQERGARLAVAAHNARADAPFRLALRAVADDSVTAARRLAADPEVRVVLGPASGTAVTEAGRAYAAARMAMVLVSAPAPPRVLELEDLVRYVCGTRVGDDDLAPALSLYLTQAAGARRTAVVEDRAGGSAASGITRMLRLVPPGTGTLTVHQVPADQAGFGTAVRAALATRPDAVVLAGTSQPRAAACARALAREGYTGARAGIEPLMGRTVLDTAGDATDGWVFAASHTEAQSMDTQAARTFTAAYRGRYGGTPGRWSAEAYDAVGLVALVLRQLGGPASWAAATR
ncbi:bifunctional serine/threonine-protein kinase/ABC transporter substrate-binding protein [Streptomyces sp. NPDC096205]|uniref:bifunctional serine/threonine-protein kinase/ABC transporter substrate-binding protein n=1 Tax=Streptomyces sp. NPDC096205 TaxID=3366081 RepID=UPI0038120798